MNESEEYKKYLKKHQAEDHKTREYRSKQSVVERREHIRSLWSRHASTNDVFLTMEVDGSDVAFLLFTDPQCIEWPERSQFFTLREACRQQLLPFKEETIRRMKAEGPNAIMDVPPGFKRHYREYSDGYSTLEGPYVYFLVWWNILTIEERAEAEFAWRSRTTKQIVPQSMWGMDLMNVEMMLKERYEKNVDEVAKRYGLYPPTLTHLDRCLQDSKEFEASGGFARYEAEELDALGEDRLDALMTERQAYLKKKAAEDQLVREAYMREIVQAYIDHPGNWPPLEVWLPKEKELEKVRKTRHLWIKAIEKAL